MASSGGARSGLFVARFSLYKKRTISWPRARSVRSLAALSCAMRTAWWMAVYPGMCIIITVFGFNILGDSLRT